MCGNIVIVTAKKKRLKEPFFPCKRGNKKFLGISQAVPCLAQATHFPRGVRCAAGGSKQRRSHGGFLSDPRAAIKIVVNTFYYILNGSHISSECKTVVVKKDRGPASRKQSRLPLSLFKRVNDECHPFIVEILSPEHAHAAPVPRPLTYARRGYRSH